MAPQVTSDSDTQKPAANGTNGTTNHQGNGTTKEVMKMEPPTTTVIVPPDGGWGWVVMIASFFCNVIVDGIVMSAGMFKEDIQKEFNVSQSSVCIFNFNSKPINLLPCPSVLCSKLHDPRTT